jgi:CO/xanthine dehydrogenase FAD-binding subunit
VLEELMKPARFSYYRPRTASEAVALMRDAGEDARFLAGGQSLVAMMNFRIVRPSALIDLSNCEDLVFIRHESGKLHIGAMTTQRDAETSALVQEHCPLVSEALSHAGPLTIRNRATVGGSIANGYPVAELPVVATCLEAEMLLTGSGAKRRVAAADFFLTGMVTDIQPGELLREIVFPAREPGVRYAFAECGNHAGGEALAIVASHARKAKNGNLSDVRIAAAGLQQVPVRLCNVERKAAEGDRQILQDAYRVDLDSMADSIEADDQQRQLVWALGEDVVGRLRATDGKAGEP